MTHRFFHSLLGVTGIIVGCISIAIGTAFFVISHETTPLNKYLYVL